MYLLGEQEQRGKKISGSSSVITSAEEGAGDFHNKETDQDK